MLFLIYALELVVGYSLRYINLRHLKIHGSEVPANFAGSIDPDTLRKTSEYTFEQSRVGLIESIADNILLVIFLFGGLMAVYDRWIGSVTNSLITCGILFFLVIYLAQSFLEIPFSLYQTFRIENRYGFNTMTIRLWITDFLKSAVISIILIALLTGGAFLLIRLSPDLWWLWVWLFFAVVTLFLMYISPYVIEPLFFKFKPVSKEGLEDDIRDLLGKAGLEISRVMEVDASRRSRHSNAYFTGIGRVKRIVLYDTLLEQMDNREILAILAHEAGHWKNHHIVKRLVLTEVGSLAVLYAAFRLLGWNGLPGLIGLENASLPAQLVILGFLGSLLGFFLTPLGSWLSRRHEWQADRFASELSGTPDALASALIKLTRENLSNLHPHPLYAKIYYSHPPMVERVGRLLERQIHPRP
ncbi:MAG TPA: M48 family metallopeptidase [Geobacteraceae bacterium]|nr:M48 family metallopeptidase [Geobacteraceae bacterium]